MNNANVREKLLIHLRKSVKYYSDRIGFTWARRIMSLYHRTSVILTAKPYAVVWIGHISKTTISGRGRGKSIDTLQQPMKHYVFFMKLMIIEFEDLVFRCRLFSKCKKYIKCIV